MKLAVLMLLCFSLFFSADATADSRVFRVVVEDTQGHQVTLYKGSYALLIGASRYTAGWPSLHTVPGEIVDVKAVLENHGFTVEVITDPNSYDLRQAFLNFINRYGFDADNRLVFFFAGHGHTRREGRRGYLVPVDAPDPLYDERGFFQKALDMDQVMTWARRIESRHALFLFDSCFSGTIFAARERPTIPPHISAATARPVRQFISAGDADQPVPARSVFAPSFVRALEGAADLNNDGYVTGTELGMYLHEQVLHYQTGQTPVYGKIRDPELDQGDFIFQLDSSEAQTSIKITSNVSGASVLLDGQSIGTAPLDSMELKPGAYTVRVERDGYEPFERRVTIAAGRMATVHAPLSPVQPRSAHLWVITSRPNAHVQIVNIGGEFHQGMELAPGIYDIEVTADGYAMKKEWIELAAGEERIVYVQLKPVVREVASTAPLDSSAAMPDSIAPPRRSGIVGRFGPLDSITASFDSPVAIPDSSAASFDSPVAIPDSSAAILDSIAPLKPVVRVWVDTEPDDARVRILNIGREFGQGMDLEPGYYLIEVTADGYEMEKEWIKLTVGEARIVYVQLKPAPQPEAPQPKKQAGYTKLGQGGTQLPDDATQAQGWLMTRDNETGLIWEVKTPENKDEKYSWDNAQKVFIARLNQQRFGSFNDWRLPEMGELETLIKKGERPTIDTNYFPNTVSSAYWSATSLAHGTSNAWRVSFNYGNVSYYNKSSSHYVRAVRAGQ